MYDTLAAAYEFTVPEALVTPAGNVEAFLPLIARAERVLDCACGIGLLAVGLAEAGRVVCATDLSPGMVERARQLAEAHGVAIDARVCGWGQLAEQGWDERFDAVLCVGNSLAHSEARRASLAAMTSVLRPGGLLVLTSRNWELEHTGLRVSDTIIERDGRRGLVVYDWLPPRGERREFDIAVAILNADGTVVTHAERMSYWPFTHDALARDLESVGLTVETDTWTREVERYLVTARR